MHVLMFPQMRKPTVEKIRRERINSSIEKLKSLLGQEFLKQQPDSRQEKADILEMTLDFLRLSSAPRIPRPAALLQLVTDAPDVCRRPSTSCLSVQCRRSPTEDCWSTSCTRSPTQRTTHECRLRSVHQPHRAAAKRKIQPRLVSGDPGRCRSMWMWTTTINSVIREHVISDLPLSWENNCPVFLYLDLTVFLPLANYASS